MTDCHTLSRALTREKVTDWKRSESSGVLSSVVQFCTEAMNSWCRFMYALRRATLHPHFIRYQHLSHLHSEIATPPLHGRKRGSNNESLESRAMRLPSLIMVKSTETGTLTSAGCRHYHAAAARDLDASCLTEWLPLFYQAPSPCRQSWHRCKTPFIYYVSTLAIKCPCTSAEHTHMQLLIGIPDFFVLRRSFSWIFMPAAHQGQHRSLGWNALMQGSTGPSTGLSPFPDGTEVSIQGQHKVAESISSIATADNGFLQQHHFHRLQPILEELHQHRHGTETRRLGTPKVAGSGKKMSNVFPLHMLGHS